MPKMVKFRKNAHLRKNSDFFPCLQLNFRKQAPPHPKKTQQQQNFVFLLRFTEVDIPVRVNRGMVYLVHASFGSVIARGVEEGEGRGGAGGKGGGGGV